MFRTSSSLLHPSCEGTSYGATHRSIPNLCTTHRSQLHTSQQYRQHASFITHAEYSRDARGNSNGNGTNTTTAKRPQWRDNTPSSYSPPPPPPENNNQPNNNNETPNSFTRALIAAAFITGLGAGVYFDSNVNVSPSNVASTEIVDRRTPNSELCKAYGYSAMALDQRLFVSFNPFNVYVSQPEVKPGCILRSSNVNVLENKKLVTPAEVDTCKRAMNTFAFVGDLEDNPTVSCVYHSEEAENQYLINPTKVVGRNSAPGPSSAEAAAATAAKQQ